MSREIVLAAHAYTYLISILLCFFLPIVIFPLTGKSKSLKTKLCLLPVSILLFVGILWLYQHHATAIEELFYKLFKKAYLSAAFVLFGTFGFGILALATSLIWKKRRTAGSILTSIYIILIPFFSLFSFFLFINLMFLLGETSTPPASILCVVLALFLSIVIFPLTGKKPKDLKLMLPTLILLFIGVLALYTAIGFLGDYTLPLLLYSILALFVFGIFALTVSFVSKRKRTVWSILISFTIILLVCLSYYAFEKGFQYISWDHFH